MNAEILKILGQVAGIGGIALGVLLILYRDVVNKNIFPNLTRSQSYNLFRLIIILVGVIALFGISSWVYSLTI